MSQAISLNSYSLLALSHTYELQFCIVALFMFFLSSWVDRTAARTRYCYKIACFFLCLSPYPLTDANIRFVDQFTSWSAVNSEILKISQTDSIFTGLYMFYGIITLLIFFGALTDRFSFDKQAVVEFTFVVLLIYLATLFLLYARSLLDLLIALEIITIGGYILVAYQKTDRFSAYAGIQYFILGAIPSGFFILGCALLYNNWGTMYLDHLDLLGIK